jgi:hypothetical protein
MVVVGAALMVVAPFLPWYTTTGAVSEISLTWLGARDNLGNVTVVLGVIAAAVGIPRMRKPLGPARALAEILIGVLGVAAALEFGLTITHLYADAEPVSAELEFGLALAFIAALLVILGASRQLWHSGYFAGNDQPKQELGKPSAPRPSTS